MVAVRKIEGIEDVSLAAREFAAQFAYAKREGEVYVCRDGMCVGARIVQAATGRLTPNVMPSTFAKRMNLDRNYPAIRELVALNDAGKLRTRKNVRIVLGLEEA